MKNITVSVTDEIYHAARIAAAHRRKSVSALVREFFATLETGKSTKKEKSQIDPELAALFAMSDRKHAKRKGSVGPLNREELYQRGVSGY